MKLEVRDLRKGFKGEDVAGLQASLGPLLYPVPKAERLDSRFGAGTFASVKSFQRDSAMSDTGVVDAATADALRDSIASSSFTVSGTVSGAMADELAGYTLRLVDKNVGGDVEMAVAPISSTGKYKIHLVIAPRSLKRRNKTQPDIQAQVLSGNALLGRSVVCYTAPPKITLDIHLSGLETNQTWTAMAIPLPRIGTTAVKRASATPFGGGDS